jgi:hypothetical protein
MTDQTAILHILAASAEAVSLDDICRALDPYKPRGPGAQHRRNVINSLGKLMTGGHAVSHRVKALHNQGGASYAATAKGRALIAADGKIKSGQKGPENGPRDPLPNSMRQRIWTAFRMSGKATLTDLAELIHREGDPAGVKVIDNARKYLKGLCRAGIAVQMRGRVAGSAPSSNGHLRFGVINDIGPKAPVCGAKDVFDPNARKRIPYKAEKKA